MIKISASASGSRLFTCTECGAQEQNVVVGRTFENLKLFNVSGQPDCDAFNDDITCGKCGHTDRVGHYQLASLAASDTIHLGVSHFNDHFISRCGQVTGSVSDGRVVFRAIEELKLAKFKPCGSCEAHEGATAPDRKLASEEDVRLISAYYEACENKRELA